jgi:uncharacterized protein (DUF433 family)
MHTVSRQAGGLAIAKIKDNVCRENIDSHFTAIHYNFNMATVVSRNPKILGGTPVFAGTRVPVESLFDYLAHGRTIDYFLEQFPSVQREQIEALLDEAKTHALSRVATV